MKYSELTIHQKINFKSKFLVHNVRIDSARNDCYVYEYNQPIYFDKRDSQHPKRLEYFQKLRIDRKLQKIRFQN